MAPSLTTRSVSPLKHKVLDHYRQDPLCSAVSVCWFGVSPYFRTAMSERKSHKVHLKQTSPHVKPLRLAKTQIPLGIFAFDSE